MLFESYLNNFVLFVHSGHGALHCNYTFGVLSSTARVPSTTAGQCIRVDTAESSIFHFFALVQEEVKPTP